jgi:hypothetical protein
VRNTVFYSWQSDLDPALTRNFIEDALTKAIKSLNRADRVYAESVIDRDTSGVAGTPGIAETIFQKIDECDVFVCDVSIVNNSSEDQSNRNIFVQLVRAVAQVILESTFRYRRVTRSSPNPNVLIELGYAASRIGWERVILVQNTAFGDMGALPFDLRSRRIVPFDLSAKESRQDERPKLRDQLEAVLRRALGDMLAPSFIPGRSIPRWFGYWMKESQPLRGGTLFIREVGSAGFFFHLDLHDGARLGNVSGFARFNGPDSAYARIGTGDENPPCEIKFRRTIDGTRRIHLDEGDGCKAFKGMGAWFDGTYYCENNFLFDSGALDELDLQRLYSITGKHYTPFVERFQQCRDGEKESTDTFVAKVTVGGAKGMYTIFEAILMKGENGQLWAAYIDGESVRYFTTERTFKDRIPKTIDKWRERFSEKEVIYLNEVDAIPDRW